MFKPDSLILYCDDVKESTSFYQGLLGVDTIERFDGFSVFELNDHFMRGLQDKHEIAPQPQPAFGGFELSMSVTEKSEVDRLFAKFQELRCQVVLTPVQLEFGYTFVILDPDGHRLRVCATDTSNIERLS